MSAKIKKLNIKKQLPNEGDFFPYCTLGWDMERSNEKESIVFSPEIIIENTDTKRMPVAVSFLHYIKKDDVIRCLKDLVQTVEDLPEWQWHAWIQHEVDKQFEGK